MTQITTTATICVTSTEIYKQPYKGYTHTNTMNFIIQTNTSFYTISHT